MRRFFIETIDEGTREAELTGEEFVHLKRVLRLGPGAEAVLFNGRGAELYARIASVGARSARLEVTGKGAPAEESPFRITLVQALLKGDRPEFIVQKATELGVSEIVFYATERTVSKVSGENADKKLARWKRAAIEAAKQCGRSVLPKIAFSSSIGAAAGLSVADMKIILWEKAGGRSMKGLGDGHRPASAAVLVGPEGGLTDEDASAAERAGFVKVSMGPRILRAETAAVAAAAALQYAFGDLN